LIRPTVKSCCERRQVATIFRVHISTDFESLKRASSVAAYNQWNIDILDVGHDIPVNKPKHRHMG